MNDQREFTENVIQVLKKNMPECLDDAKGIIGKTFQKSSKKDSNSTHASHKGDPHKCLKELNGIEIHNSFQKKRLEKLIKLIKNSGKNKKDFINELEKLSCKIEKCEQNKNRKKGITIALKDFSSSKIIGKFMEKRHSNTGNFLKMFCEQISKILLIEDEKEFIKQAMLLFEKWSNCTFSIISKNNKKNATAFCKEALKIVKEIYEKLEKFSNTSSHEERNVEKQNSPPVPPQSKSPHGDNSPETGANPGKTAHSPQSKFQNTQSTVAQHQTAEQQELSTNIKNLKLYGNKLAEIDWRHGLKTRIINNTRMLIQISGLEGSKKIAALNSNITNAIEILGYCSMVMVGSNDVDKGVLKNISEEACRFLDNSCEYLKSIKNLPDSVTKNLIRAKAEVETFRKPSQNNQAIRKNPYRPLPKRPLPKRPLPRDAIEQINILRRIGTELNKKLDKNSIWLSAAGQKVLSSIEGLKTTGGVSENQYCLADILENIINLKNYIQSDKNAYAAAKEIFEAARKLLKIWLTELNKDMQNKDIQKYKQFITDLLNRYQKMYPQRLIPEISVLPPEKEKEYQTLINEKAEGVNHCLEKFRNMDTTDIHFQKVLDYIKGLPGLLKRRTNKNMSNSEEMKSLNSYIGATVITCKEGLVIGDVGNREYSKAIFELLKALCDELDIRIQYYKETYKDTNSDSVLLEECEKILEEGRKVIKKFNDMIAQSNREQSSDKTPNSAQSQSTNSTGPKAPPAPPTQRNSAPKTVTGTAAKPAGDHDALMEDIRNTGKKSQDSDTTATTVAPLPTTQAPPAEQSEKQLKNPTDGVPNSASPKEGLPDQVSDTQDQGQDSSVAPANLKPNPMEQIRRFRKATAGDDDHDYDYTDALPGQGDSTSAQAPLAPPDPANAAVAAAPVNPAPQAPPPPPRKSPLGTAASVNPAPAPAVAAADTAAPPPDPAPAKDQLLEQIRKGKRLKKAEDRKIPQAAQSESNNDMGRTMLNAFAARFNSSQNRYKNGYISSEDATKMLTQLCKEVKNLNSESDFEKYSEEIKNFDEGLSRSLTSQNNVSEREALKGLQNNELKKLKMLVGELIKTNDKNTNDKNKRKRILAGVDGIVKSINGEWE